MHKKSRGHTSMYTDSYTYVYTQLDLSGQRGGQLVLGSAQSRLPPCCSGSVCVCVCGCTSREWRLVSPNIHARALACLSSSCSPSPCCPPPRIFGLFCTRA